MGKGAFAAVGSAALIMRRRLAKTELNSVSFTFLLQAETEYRDLLMCYFCNLNSSIALVAGFAFTKDFLREHHCGQLWN